MVQQFTGRGAASFDSSFVRRDNSRKWKTALSPAQIHLVQRTVGRALTDYGYEKIAVAWSARVKSVVLSVYYAAKTPLALLANIRRITRPLQMFKRRLIGTA